MDEFLIFKCLGMLQVSSAHFVFHELGLILGYIYSFIDIIHPYAIDTLHLRNSYRGLDTYIVYSLSFHVVFGFMVFLGVPNICESRMYIL
jgi:hypothetical protein